MIKSISYWSMKQGLDNTHPIAEALDEAQEAGFEGLELCIAPEGVLHVNTTQAECEAIRQIIDDKKMIVETLASGMSWGVNPTSEDPAVRQQAIDLHKAALQRAAWLGCDAMLYVPGLVGAPFVPEHIRYDKAVERAREAVKRLLDTAEEVGVDLCVENVWNGLFYSPVEFADFIDSFGSDRLGIYFDLGNVIGYHQYPPHWIEMLGKRIQRLHIKDYECKFDWSGSFSFCSLLEGQVPFEECIAALKQIGYDKTMVAEMMPWDKNLLSRTSQAMDKILAM